MRWVVTGANRGIGLEFVKQIVARGDAVEAGTREPERADALATLAKEGNVRVHRCDVGDDASVRAFAAAIGDVAIDVVVNNAGVMGTRSSLETLDPAEVLRTFDVNAVGPLRVTRALLGQLKRGKTRKIAHVTSGLGSITDNTSGGAFGYRMSKAALNMANKSMSVELASDGFTCVVINPGWVATDMGGAGAPTRPEESVKNMIGIITSMTPDRTGTFFDHKGGTYPY